METFAEVFNKNLNNRPAPTLEEIQSNLEKLNRLFSVFETPEYRELIRFAVEWEKLGRELRALKLAVNERLVQKKHANPIDGVS